MRHVLCSASSVAALMSLAVFPATAQEAGSQAVQVAQAPTTQQSSELVQADQTAAAESAEDDDRVVVTGSLFAGTPEDSPLPVQVFSVEELEEQGSPTALDFARNLAISGPTGGDSNAFGGGGYGNVQFNLRGIGADKTLTLLNGRRMSENSNLVPSNAMSRLEILKDGAAVVYGADASGGVVNFITRTDFTGLEVSGKYKYIKDSEGGDYGLSVLGGFGEGESNFLWAFDYTHRSILNSEDRPDIVLINRDINPFPWSTLSNTAIYNAYGARPTVPAGNSAAQEFGPPITGNWADFTRTSCEAVHGYYLTNAAGAPTSCASTYMPFINLADDQDTYRFYSQYKSALSDNVDFDVVGVYGQIVGTIKGAGGNAMVRGPGRSIGSVNQLYVPRENPGFMDFATRSGLINSPNFASVAGVSPQSYRIYGHSGSPFWWGKDDSINIFNDTQTFHVSSGLRGTLGDFSDTLKDIGFDFAVTYNQQIAAGGSWDIVGWKLDEALNGFGGPNCNAPDLNPYQFGTQNPGAAGKNGCQWFNPFASSFASQPQLGLANPVFVPALENNSRSLHDWMVDPWNNESVSTNLIVDLVLRGETPLALPGGKVAIAGGTQWGQDEFRQTLTDSYSNGLLPCEWPSNFTTGVTVPDGPDAGTDPDVIAVPQQPRNPSDPLFTGCTEDRAGPGVFRPTNPPSNADLQHLSFFGEAQVPVFDNLNLILAVRREDFSNNLGATIYKVSGKWNVWGPLSVRASYGTNYQAPAASLVPGEINNANLAITRAAGNWRTQSTVTRADIRPETATVQNYGVIWQSQGFAADHDLTLILDYFDIETKDPIGQLAGANDIVNSVFSGAAVPGSTGFFFANCSSPFIGRVQFNDVPSAPGGQCVQGVTTSDDFGLVRTELGNGPGDHVAGFDFQGSYRMPLGPGDLSLNADASLLTKYDRLARTLDGVVIAPADDRLGFLNKEGGGSGTVAEVRANASANYGLGKHNLNFGVTYVSAVEDDRPGIQYGEFGDDWIVARLTYMYDIDDSLRLRATVDNLFDRNPPPSQQEFSFDPLIGNALGRTIEVSLTKTF